MIECKYPLIFGNHSRKKKATNENHLEESIALLRNEKWYPQWKQAVIDQGETEEHIFNTYMANDWVLFGFMWNKEKNGFDFWNNINTIWMQMCITKGKWDKTDEEDYI